MIIEIINLSPSESLFKIENVRVSSVSVMILLLFAL